MSRSSVASRPSSAASSGPAARAFAWFDRHAVPAMRRLGELAFVVAVREALPWSFGALAAAFGVILALQWRTQDVALGLRLASALLPAFGIMAGALAVVLSVRVAVRTGYAPVPVVAAGLAAFALALPPLDGKGPIDYLRALGATGLFIAILVCGLVATTIAVTRRVLRAPGADWTGAAIAVGIVAALFAAHVSVASGVEAAIRPLASLGDSYVALIVIVLVETLLWTAGVHGPAVLAAVVTPVYLTMQMANTHAWSAHAPLPYVVTVSLFLFVFPGGAGATLPLCVMLAFSRVTRLRHVGRITLLPSLFNINDPLLFGAPVVFNPYLAVPFVAAPLVLATTTYLCLAFGLVARAAFYVPSSIPTFVSTYLATQDPRAIVLALVNVAIAAAIYFPFVRAYERHVEETA